MQHGTWNCTLVIACKAADLLLLSLGKRHIGTSFPKGEGKTRAGSSKRTLAEGKQRTFTEAVSGFHVKKLNTGFFRHVSFYRSLASAPYQASMSWATLENTEDLDYTWRC